MSAKTQDLQTARWDDVRVFLAAYRARSLGVAAARLGLDTSTLSRRVATLEDTLGQRLFERTRAGLLPLPAAELLLAAAETMEGGFARLTRDAESQEDPSQGVVRLSAAPGMLDTFVTPALPRFYATHPHITLELDASSRVLDLTRHEADLALRSVKPRGAELVITRIATARWIAVGSPTLVRELGRLAAWSDAPWLTWDRDLASWGPARWLTQHGEGAPIRLRSSHFAAQIGAARLGLGLMLLPEPYVVRHGLLPVSYAKKLAPSAAAWPSDQLWMVCPRALRDVPRVAAVWSFMTDELRRAVQQAEAL